MLVKTDQQKQIVKNFLNKKIGFELPDECDINVVVILNGKDKLIFIKGFMSNIELISFLNDNQKYQKLFCDNNELAFSLFSFCKI